MVLSCSVQFVLNPSWQASQPEAYDASQFSIKWEQKSVICPQGYSSRSWTSSYDSWNNPIITVNFAHKTRRECPTRSLCTRSLRYPRSLTLHPQAEQEALQQARQRQTTSEWKQLYNMRAGIEGTISQAVASFGLRPNRYRGSANTNSLNACYAYGIDNKFPSC